MRARVPFCARVPQSPRRPTGHTPNIITTYAVVFKLFMCLSLWYGHIASFLWTSILAYVFDCMDGQYARRYRMTSVVGDPAGNPTTHYRPAVDWYDHVTDVGAWLCILCILWVKYRRTVTKWHVVLAAATLGTMIASVGCVQQASQAYNDNKPEMLDGLSKVCPKQEQYNRRIRCLGSGVCMSIWIMLILHLMILRLRKTTMV